MGRDVLRVIKSMEARITTLEQTVSQLEVLVQRLFDKDDEEE